MGLFLSPETLKDMGLLGLLWPISSQVTSFFVSSSFVKVMVEKIRVFLFPSVGFQNPFLLLYE